MLQLIHPLPPFSLASVAGLSTFAAFPPSSCCAMLARRSSVSEGTFTSFDLPSAWSCEGCWASVAGLLLSLGRVGCPSAEEEGVGSGVLWE